MSNQQAPLLCKSSSFRAVLFDLDGTLIDSASELASAANGMLVARNMSPKPLDAYRPHCGGGVRALLQIAFGITDTDPNFLSMREEFFLRYEQHMGSEESLFPGIRTLIEVLEKHGTPWGIVTNKIERFTLPLLAGIPLLQRAYTVISGDTMSHAKPNPAPLLEAARRIHVPAISCIYVGDGERDIIAGRSAGMFTIAVSYGFIDKNTMTSRWNPDAVASNTEQLKDLLVG